ncbi:hypothetical protein R1sor_012044 [Riccia sorocarpa]|uniref:SWIM-type domain-containing protein n=1 Tax=Riccia sorocarpa TaxID=122646 RepID=A0ABD3I2P0_9MARC
MKVERDCRRCNKSLPIEDFSRRQCRSNVTKVHRECNVCFSSRQTTRLYDPVPDTPNEELVVKTCTYEQLSHMASVTFREAAIDEVVVYQHWVVDCSEEYMEALTSWEESENPRLCFKKWVDDVVRTEVEAGSGLYWELRTWGRLAYRPNEFGATMRCVSRQDKAQVNYWVAEIESWRYGAGEPNQLKSSKDFIERPENRAKGFELILYEKTDDFEAFSFLTPFWRYVSTVKEVLTDSTSKTNDLQFEMFALIGNLGGFGVPLCYMFYLKKTSVDESTPNGYQARGCRKGLLYEWMCKLREKGLRLAFFITDKDACQIEAAQRSIPEMHVQLCLKHCLDAIERRMVAVDRGTNPYDPPAAHNIFPFIDPTWGPSVGDIVRGSICPSEHRPNWVKLAEREPAARGYYVTDVSTWMCFCPAFVSAKYLICKHLVLGYTTGVSAEVPVYLQTYKRFEPSFYVFQSSENFFSTQTMRPESDPWYEQPAYVEHGMPEDIGIGGIDLNENPIKMIHADDPETKDGGADENVAAIAGFLAEVNVSGDDDSAGEAASRGRHTSVLQSLGWKSARIRVWVRSPTGKNDREKCWLGLIIREFGYVVYVDEFYPLIKIVNGKAERPAWV